ncbi:MAG TPA: glycosyltransferase family 39 protein, partial [Acidobacteriaceae bacterium]|nr:glycosyltransferase family 39 protein [Acidobacteriaceae bacterium]
MNLGEKQKADPNLLGRSVASISRGANALADRLERRSAIFLPVLFLLYIWILKSDRIKPLWHDELYTFYIAQAPTFGKMMEWTHTIDLNPPLYYIAARLTFHVLHPSALTVRLPAMIAYFVATLCAYQFVRRRLTPLYGLLAAMVMLASSFNQYSYEARPYAFVLGFLGILALAWQRAIQDDKPRSWIAYVFVLVGGFGMLLSHVLASVAYAALLLTEAIRFAMRRKPDLILW